MNILENYNNAKQKYGIEIVELLTKQGLPPQYLLSACRFQTEYQMSTERIVQLFKDWVRYVVRYSQIDVNTKNFDEFIQLIAQGKREHFLPHILYKDEDCILYGIDNIKDARNLPNDYCIKAVRKYNILKNDGYSFILIFLPNQQFPYTYVVASIHNGNVDYWDGQNYKLYNNEADNYRYEQYEDLLPNEAKAIIHSTSAKNQENINCNIKMNKNKIRLTESQLSNIIKETAMDVMNNVVHRMSDGDYDKLTHHTNFKEIPALFSKLQTAMENVLYSSELDAAIEPRMGKIWNEVKNDIWQVYRKIGKYEDQFELCAFNQYNPTETPTINTGRAYNPYTGKYEKMSLKDAYNLVQQILRDDDMYFEDFNMTPEMAKKNPWKFLDRIASEYGNIDNYDKNVNREYNDIYGND